MKSTISESTPRIAFEATAAARAALSSEEVLPVNVDVDTAVAIVLRASAHLERLRESIVDQLPKFDLAQFDAIPIYAQALADAHRYYLAAAEPKDGLPELAARAAELRDTLLADTRALVRRGHVDGKQLDDLRGGNGFLSIGTDLNVLEKILRARWTSIATHTGVEMHELDQARDLFERIMVAHANRQARRASDAADGARRRAFTLLVRAYQRARYAAAYLWAERGNADELLPSLWTQRRRAKTTKETSEPPERDARQSPARRNVPGDSPPL